MTKTSGDQRDPSRPEATPALEGSRLLRVGLVREAVREFEKALAAQPEDPAALLGLARAWLTLCEPDRARATLQRLLEAQPENAEARSHLAMLDAQRGDPGAIDRLREAATEPKAGFFAHFNLGTVLAAAGQLDNAEVAFRRALELQPESPYAHFELGRLAMRRPDYAAAAKEFAHAAQLAPADYVPLLMLSRAQAAQGSLGQAAQTLSQALPLAPREPALHEDLFRLSMLAGSPQGAMKEAIELRQIAPDSANYAYMFGLAALALGQVPEARQALELALEKDPGAWQAKQALAQVCLALKDESRATSLLEQVVAAHPTELGPINDLAVIYLARPGASARAEEILGPALQVHPGDPAANLNMALALQDRARQRAAGHARKALASPQSEVRDQAKRLLEKLG